MLRGRGLIGSAIPTPCGWIWEKSMTMFFDLAYASTASFTFCARVWLRASAAATVFFGSSMGTVLPSLFTRFCPARFSP